MVKWRWIIFNLFYIITLIISEAYKPFWNGRRRSI